MKTKEIAELIAKSKKTTPAKIYLQGRFNEEDFAGQDFQAFGHDSFWILIGDYSLLERWMTRNRRRIKRRLIDVSARFSALPLLDLRTVKARVEPGAIIRQGARIGNDCIIMMGAVINVGAEVGPRTMVDMNAVLGARAIVGRDCHIGAGAVVAGVLEPPSQKPVVIRDGVLVGANAVVLEGVRVGRRSVVAAGAVVIRDVPPGVVVAGVPAKVIKAVSEISQREKISLVGILRGLKE